MGYIAHHAIVVTGYGDEASKAHAKAVELFTDIDPPQHNTERLVSPIVQSLTNGYLSFLIAPDGSKEGWSTSEAGDAARSAFIDWLRGQQNAPDWVLVRFGGDDYDHCVVDDHGGVDTDPGPWHSGHAETPEDSDENGSDDQDGAA